MAAIDKATTAKAFNWNAVYPADTSLLEAKVEWGYLKEIFPYAPMRWAKAHSTQSEMLGKIVKEGCKIHGAGRMALLLLNRAYQCNFPLFTHAKKNGTDVIGAISQAYAEFQAHAKLLVTVKPPQMIQAVYFTRRTCMRTYVPKDAHCLNKAILHACNLPLDSLLTGSKRRSEMSDAGSNDEFEGFNAYA
jgi:hypothetical protein